MLRSTSKTCKECHGPITAEAVADRMYPLVLVPFDGDPIAVRLKTLNQAQILSCKQFSLIDLSGGTKRNDRMTIEGMRRCTRIQCQIAQIALVKPTYNQMLETLGDVDGTIKEVQGRIQALEERLKKVQDGAERDEMAESIERIKALHETVLPNDFLGKVTAYALGLDKSDMGLVTRGTLLDVAILAEQGHNNPADHLHGRFTDFMKDDINRHAWNVLHERREEEKAKRKGGK